MKNKNGIVKIANKLDTITIVKFSDVLAFMISVNTAEDTPVGSAARKNKLIWSFGSTFEKRKNTMIGSKIKLTMHIYKIVNGVFMWVTTSKISTFKKRSSMIDMIMYKTTPSKDWKKLGKDRPKIIARIKKSQKNLSVCFRYCIMMNFNKINF